MAYAIMRVEKIKNVTKFAQIERHHNERHRLTHRAHAEKEKENKEIFSKNFYERQESLKERFEKRTEGVKIRKNSVLAAEIVLTFSPDFQYSDKWRKENLRWLTNTFGPGNTLSVQYHADEKTPHLHAFVVPLRDGKLSAKYWFNGAEALSKLQDSYAASMAQFGLERGKNYVVSKEPVPHHKGVKEFWRDEERKEIEMLKEKVFGGEER